MNAWSLPTSLTIGGVGYEIKTDFRDVLRVLRCFSDPDLEEDEKWLVCMQLLFLEPGLIPWDRQEEAAEQVSTFIDMGIKENGNRKKPSTMDWDFDAPIIIPAVNRVLGCEIRSVPYIHWWTFLGAYMEIGESLFSAVINVRSKKLSGKKLEQSEREFYKENKNLIVLPQKHSAEEKERLEKIRALFRGKSR